jgi:copper chaperone CopZ
LAKEATSELKVPAMDCAACTVVIERALTQIKGVKAVDLKVDKRTATIVYEDTQVKQAEIQKTIEKAGFKTEPSSSLFSSMVRAGAHRGRRIIHRSTHNG